MNHFRFSLARLFGAVVLLAAGLAALVGATPIWANSTFTVTLGILLLAVGGVVYRDGARRAFWLGFLVLGWSYLAFAFGPWFRPNLSDRLATTQALAALHGQVARFETPKQSARARVLWFRSDGSIYLDGQAIGSTDLRAELDLRTKAQDFVEMFSDPGYTVPERHLRAVSVVQLKKPIVFKGFEMAVSSPAFDDFEQVGHSLFALLFAFLGGLITRCFYATRELRP